MWWYAVGIPLASKTTTIHYQTTICIFYLPSIGGVLLPEALNAASLLPHHTNGRQTDNPTVTILISNGG